MNKYLVHLKNFITNPGKRHLILNSLCFFKGMDDEEYLRRRYYAVFKKYPDLQNPKGYNEKLCWLKLHNFRDEYTKMTDKYEAKKYVASIIGEKYIIPTLGVWDSFEAIDLDALPQSFVIKVTHDSGGVYVIKDKSKVSISKIKRKLGWRFKRNFYYVGRSKEYRDIKPRIIAEKYMEDLDGEGLADYKVFCFDGEPRLIEVIHGRSTGKFKRRIFDTDWNQIYVGFHGEPPVHEPMDRPPALEELLELSRKLSKNLKHVRADFYMVGDKIYFGELTFHHNDGLSKFTPESFDLELGKYLDLTDIKPDGAALK
ncbi:MAG: glycosyl transferase [Lachnospiraceae bacterium]|nr:glycosyl transferase [Lachnospiraceae bacterium]